MLDHRKVVKTCYFAFIRSIFISHTLMKKGRKARHSSDKQLVISNNKPKKQLKGFGNKSLTDDAPTNHYNYKTYFQLIWLA